MYTVLFLIRQNTTKILCLIKAISNINTGNITTISVANFNMRWNKPIPFLCLCFVKKIVIFSLKYCSIDLKITIMSIIIHILTTTIVWKRTTILILHRTKQIFYQNPKQYICYLRPSFFLFSKTCKLFCYALKLLQFWIDSFLINTVNHLIF